MKLTIFFLQFFLLVSITFADNVEILKAEYGADKNENNVPTWNNVTTIIKKRIAKGETSLLVSNGLLGDPLPYEEKIFRLTYKIDGKTEEVGFPEGSMVKLDAKSLRAYQRYEAQLYTPGGTMDIVQRISNAAKAGQKKVVIPKAIYHFKAPLASTAHLDLSNLNEIEIDASGSTFIFESDYKSGIAFVNCNKTIFRNATLENQTPPFSQGNIIAISPDGRIIDVKVHDGYPMTIQDGYNTPVLNFFDPITRKLKKNARLSHIESVKQIGPGVLRFHLRKNDVNLSVVAPGDMTVWRRVEGREVSFVNCADMKFTNVTMKNSIGAGVAEFGGDGGNYYNYSITYAAPPEGASQKPLLSGSADGFYSMGTKHGPTVENCFFEGIHDDGVNIGSKYFLVLECTGNSAIVAACSFRFGVGDKIRFYDYKYSDAGDAKLLSFKKITNYKESPEVYKKHGSFRYRYRGPNGNLILKMTFDRAPNLKPGFYATDLDRCGQNFIVRNCTFKDKRGRGCLVRGSGIIENCLFENILMGGVNAIPEFHSFSEGPYVDGLIVKNNTFRNVGMANQYFTGTVNISGFEGRFIELPGGHRNVLIENNRFENNDGPNIVISTATNVTIKNNIFITPMENQSLNTNAGGLDCNALIWVTQSKDVKMEGNIVEKPGPFMKKTISIGQNVSGNGFDHGILVEK